MRRCGGALALAAIALLAGCAGPPGADRAVSAPDAEPRGALTVYAAASLKAAFDELATQFEARHPEVDVRPIVYDGSSTLATQVIEGAPADVFASADEPSMQKVVDEGLAATPELFATNTLVIAVPASNPGGVEDLSDLADDDVTVVLCAPEVPCGAASRTLLADQGVTVTPVSSEQNVTAVLTKVAAGEADAGLVYATDVRGRADVASLVPAGAEDVVNRYAIVALADAGNPVAARAFAVFVLGPEARVVLDGLGFGQP